METKKNAPLATAVIIRPRDLTNYTGLSRSTIWRLEKKGMFVPRIRLSQHTIGYRRKDIETWINERVEAKVEEGSNNEK